MKSIPGSSGSLHALPAGTGDWPAAGKTPAIQVERDMAHPSHGLLQQEDDGPPDSLVPR